EPATLSPQRGEAREGVACVGARLGGQHETRRRWAQRRERTALERRREREQPEPLEALDVIENLRLLGRIGRGRPLPKLAERSAARNQHLERATQRGRGRAGLERATPRAQDRPARPFDDRNPLAEGQAIGQLGNVLHAERALFKETSERGSALL